MTPKGVAAALSGFFERRILPPDLFSNPWAREKIANAKNFVI
jgi:hypothetical protein